MSTEANADVLVYGTDGWSVVERGEQMFSLATEEVTNSIYSTLPYAFAAAVRAGYDPKHWRRADAETVMALDQAEHWRSLMARGTLRRWPPWAEETADREVPLAGNATRREWLLIT